jgi:hypothetical protein
LNYMALQMWSSYKLCNFIYLFLMLAFNLVWSRSKILEVLQFCSRHTFWMFKLIIVHLCDDVA